jgi:hypothetical protein
VGYSLYIVEVQLLEKRETVKIRCRRAAVTDAQTVVFTALHVEGKMRQKPNRKPKDVSSTTKKARVPRDRAAADFTPAVPSFYRGNRAFALSMRHLVPLRGDKKRRRKFDFGAPNSHVESKKRKHAKNNFIDFSRDFVAGVL